MSIGNEAAAIDAVNSRSRKSKEYVICISILLVLTALFRFTDLDLRLGDLFFTPEEGWKYSSSVFCTLVYEYGELPGLALTAAAGVVLVLGWFKTRFVRYRKPALFVVLLLAIGPGLVVNGFMKYQSGRPRPRDVAVFSGTQPFHKVGEMGVAGTGNSFPSGHAAMGFFLAAPYFILRGSNRGRAVYWLVLGLSSGVVIGIVRMAQGGHFASDILWAWGIVHLTALGLSSLLQLDTSKTAV